MCSKRHSFQDHVVCVGIVSLFRDGNEAVSGLLICLISWDKTLYHKKNLYPTQWDWILRLLLKPLEKTRSSLFINIPKFLRYESGTARIQLTSTRKLCAWEFVNMKKKQKTKQRQQQQQKNKAKRQISANIPRSRSHLSCLPLDIQVIWNNKYFLKESFQFCFYH